MTEFELIYRYFKQHETQAFYADSSVIKALGDDAAVIAWSNGSIPYTSKSTTTAAPTHQTLMTTCVDTLVQGRHFSDEWSQVNKLAFAIGFKSVAVNISDISAMGAKPHSILLALALPKRLANEGWLSEFSKGLFHACTVFGVRLIGGDTTRHDKLVISVTANGVMQDNTQPIYRSGANVGDKVYVSGTLGDASYTLQHPDTDIGAKLAHRLHMPTPRVRLAQLLAKQGQVSAMMDVSDGLLQDLSHICRQSGVGMRIDLQCLPASALLRSVALTERLPYQLTGGDDYELIFTLPAQYSPPQYQQSTDCNNNDDNKSNGDRKKPLDTAALASQTHTPVTCIGEVIKAAPQTNKNSSIHKEALSPVTIEDCIELHFNDHKITEDAPYPFSKLPDLQGFQHFNETTNHTDE